MIDTPFGSRFVFDSHTHFFDRTFLDALGGQLVPRQGAAEVARRLGWDEPPADPEGTARQWVAEMDRHGVDRMVAIHTLPGEPASAGRGIGAARGRLLGYVTVNPLAPGALQQVRAAVTDFGFRGVALFPAMFHFSLTSDAVYSVLQLADEQGLNGMALP